MKALFVLLILALIAACATTSATTTTAGGTTTLAAPATLQDKLTADLTQAIADATASKDLMAPQRAICYRTILALVPQLPAVSVQSHEVAGVFDAFELAAERVEAVEAVSEYQLPADVRLKLLVDCGPIQARANDLLVKFNLRVVRIGGQAALLAK
jgi:hypothetical protein